LARENAADDGQQGGLAGTAGSLKAYHGAPLNLEADVMEGGYLVGLPPVIDLGNVFQFDKHG
jgi:hypothetical protein